MVKPRDNEALQADEYGQTPGLAVVFCDLPPNFPVSHAELAAIERLLGEDLEFFLGSNQTLRQS